MQLAVSCSTTCYSCCVCASCMQKLGNQCSLDYASGSLPEIFRHRTGSYHDCKSRSAVSLAGHYIGNAQRCRNAVSEFVQAAPQRRSTGVCAQELLLELICICIHSWQVSLSSLFFQGPRRFQTSGMAFQVNLPNEEAWTKDIASSQTGVVQGVMHCVIQRRRSSGDRLFAKPVAWLRSR